MRPPTYSERLETLSGLFAEALGVESVEHDDDFFRRGGNSLAAAALANRIRSTLGVRITVRDLFRVPTVAGLMEVIEKNDSGTSPMPGKRPYPDPLPASYAQQRIWLTTSFDDTAAYHMPFAISMRGGLNVTALRSALQDVVARHEILRTLYAHRSGMVVQRILTSADVPLKLIDCAPPELAAGLRAEAGIPFDLGRDIPIHATLFRLTGDHHTLLLTIHHIAADGTSMPLLLRDLSAAYTARLEGMPPRWSASPVQYGDYTLWQRDHLGDAGDDGSRLNRQARFWETELAGLPEEATLPGDRPRPRVHDGSGAIIDFVLSPETQAGLNALAREHGATPFMALNAGVAASLSRSGAGDDVPIGAPVAGQESDGMNDRLGHFINIVVLRADVSGDPGFGELLRRVKGSAMAAYQHQDVPFDQVVRRLNPRRSRSRHPLFQVMLVLNGDVSDRVRLPGLRTDVSTVHPGTAKFDLLLEVRETFDAHGGEAGIHGTAEYSTALYDRDTIARFAAGLTRLLDDAVANPDAPISTLARAVEV